MKKILLAIIALLSIVSLADAYIGVRRAGIGVGRVGVVRRPFARAAIRQAAYEDYGSYYGGYYSPAVGDREPAYQYEEGYYGNGRCSRCNSCCARGMR